MTTLSKAAIAEILENIARLLELKEENPFKIRAYTNAAHALETFGGNLPKLVEENRLEEIPGIGKAISEKIRELVETGELQFYRELRSEFPEKIFELFSMPGLGARKIKALHERLKIGSIDELAAACRDGRVGELPGFGKKTADNLLKAIEMREKHAGSFRLGDVATVAERIANDLRDHPDAIQVSAAGSYRRRKEVLHDLDFIVSTRKPEAISEYFVTHETVESVLVHGETKSSVRLHSGVQADLRVVKPEEFAFALNYFTGSKEHNIVMRNRALDRGWTLNEYRLEDAPARAGGKKSKAADPIPAVREERDLYRALGLAYIEPELRENCGEFAAAERDELPRLVELQHLRGTFHNHTTASDGLCSLEEMAAGAQDLGLQYLGIADHSKSSVIANGLDEKRLEAQIIEIEKLNATFDGFRLFTGTECDILKDGTLDFSDELLGRLDYVVASIHSSFNLPERDMTRRIIRAIENPNVTFLGHLTGRLLLVREGYAVDVPAVIDAAAATKTIIELNSNPRRLDMDWRWWPLAKEKGVRCAINTDAHDLGRLQHLWFGVAAARKGWLTRDDVVNTLPLGRIEKALRVKRDR
jgi:DNA polymerase (family 10)